MTASRALVPVPARGTLTYTRCAVFNPISISVMTIAIAVVAGFGGVLGASVVAAMIASVCASLTWFDGVRATIDRHLERRANEAREVRHLEQLRSASPARREQCCAVAHLVDQIEETHRDEARRFELRELLDELVHVAVLHARCERALAAGGELPSDPARSKLSPRTRAIVDRRSELHAQCKRRVDELAEHLDAIEQLVRLIAQRVACGAIEHESEAELDRRLEDVDEIDRAFVNLSA